MASILLEREAGRRKPVTAPSGATMTNRFRLRLLPSVLAFFLAMGWAASARAQGFISPLIGFNFGGDANCPAITGCEDKRLNFGVSLGKMGSVFGFEEE